MKRFEQSRNLGFSSHSQKSNPRGPSRESYDRLRTDPDFDHDFYRQITSLRTRADFLPLRIRVTRSTDERELRAFVRAMFTSPLHRNEVSSCIRGYVGKRAIPALLWNLERLPPPDRMFQSRLLCLLGNLESFGTYCKAVLSLDHLHGAAYASVRSFLTDDTPSLLSGLPTFLNDHDDASFLLWAPYFHKHSHGPITDRLTTIASNTVAALQSRNTALRLLIGFAPKQATACLIEHGSGFPLPILLRRLEQLDRSEGGSQQLPELLQAFVFTDDDRRLAARLFMPSADPNARELQLDWITDQLNLLSARPYDHDLRRQINIVGQRLCKQNHPEWIEFLEASAAGGPLSSFARDLLINAGHSLGLRHLCAEIDAAMSPAELFRPCVMAVRKYREDATCVLDRVIASGHAKLTARINEIIAEIWPGKTIGDLRRTAETETDTIAPRLPTRTPRTVSLLTRDRDLADEVKVLEQYGCQVCGRHLINVRTGEPYAESHHIHPLGHGGSDTMDNLLCLCPLCHELFHLGCVGIDSRLRICVTAAMTEPLFAVLRVANNRTISVESLRYHWSVLFIPPASVRFDRESAV